MITTKRDYTPWIMLAILIIMTLIGALVVAPYNEAHHVVSPDSYSAFLGPR